MLAAHIDDILRRLCDKAIWLDHGALVEYGKLDHILAAYRGRERVAAGDP
jgi:ABC-type polysaccharide/polyol phosphate transport system ATPase subunit